MNTAGRIEWIHGIKYRTVADTASSSCNDCALDKDDTRCKAQVGCSSVYSDAPRGFHYVAADTQ